MPTRRKVESRVEASDRKPAVPYRKVLSVGLGVAAASFAAAAYSLAVTAAEAIVDVRTVLVVTELGAVTNNQSTASKVVVNANTQ